jgi:acetylornithine/succinyldiaminopimelate/putrescine aminotransferase
MSHLSENPVLGHITTFGGHPVSCAAGMAAFRVLLDDTLVKDVAVKQEIFKNRLHHQKIISLRSFGLWMAVEFSSAELCKRIVDDCISNGIMTDWFLFAPHCLRISPPLIITEEEINASIAVITKAIERQTTLT